MVYSIYQGHLFFQKATYGKGHYKCPLVAGASQISFRSVTYRQTGFASAEEAWFQAYSAVPRKTNKEQKKRGKEAALRLDRLAAPALRELRLNLSNVGRPKLQATGGRRKAVAVG